MKYFHILVFYIFFSVFTHRYSRINNNRRNEVDLFCRCCTFPQWCGTICPFNLLVASMDFYHKDVTQELLSDVFFPETL